MSESDKDKPKVLSKNLFPVVGIGASAGGLEAFKKLIKAIPKKTGMAYILVQHLHPDHASALPEILQRETKMKVNEIRDHVKVKPDEVYIIPANKMLVATDGILELSPRPKDHKNMPIDVFFSSLAEVHQSHAIGIVLSGNGIDGTLGLANIKNSGGLTFAQDIESARFDSMPQNAIKAGVVDFILPPEDMPGKLFTLHQAINNMAQIDDATPTWLSEEEGFKKVLYLIRLKYGVDFTHYKQTTILRRILRRMVILRQEKIIDYLGYLEKNNAETDVLFQDLLIPVTFFFRDLDIFHSLCKTVLPELIKNKSTIDPLRIWVAGCATGKEAYSISICLHEYLRDKISNIKVQIFATDISEKSIEKARTGIYDKGDMEGLTDEQLQQFFIKTNGSYQVKKMIRDTCVFACHNFLKDPPFAKMDFVSCRNVLIYMDPFLQKKAFTIFHYSLNPKGYLWLGKAESPGSTSEYFLTLGNKERIYTKKVFPGRFMNVTSARSEEILRDKNYGLTGNEKRKDDFQKDADDILLTKYTPPGVIVNDQFDIVQFRGATGDFLEPSPGKASLNVLKMAREGLSFELRNALQKAKKTRKPFSKENVPVNNQKKIIDLEVIPLLNSIDLHFLVLFKEPASAINENAEGKSEQKQTISKKQQEHPEVKKLEKNLSDLREDMRSIAEDQEAVNEELQSSNEELLSSSEELQSLNEELETSKEELLSTNEELITVNQELYDRNKQYNEARIYAEAIVSTIHEPLLVIDKDFKIKSVNQSFYKNFSIIEQDTIGKNLFELQNNGWDIPGLRNQLLKIQKGNANLLNWEDTYTFPLVGKRTICFNAQPVQKENSEGLILLAMEDITIRTRLKFERTRLLTRFQTLVKQAPVAIMILKGKDYIVELANDYYLELVEKEKDFIGKPIFESIPELKTQGIKELLDSVMQTGNPYYGNEVEVQMPRNKKSKLGFFNFIYQPVIERDEAITGIIVVATEVTEQVMARKKIEESKHRYQNMIYTSPSLISIFKGENMIIEIANDAILKSLGLEKKVIGKSIFEVLPGIKAQGFGKHLLHVYKTGFPYHAYEMPVNIEHSGKKELLNYTLIYQAQRNLEGEIEGVAVIGNEVTSQTELNKKIKDSEAHFRQMSDLMPAKISNRDKDGNVLYFNQNWLDYTGLSFDELKNLGYYKIIHPDELEEFKKRIRQATETGDDLEMEVRFKNKKGEYKWHLNRVSPIKDDDGKIKMWIGAATDIHEQKTKEEIKDEFIGVASHELKTPLTTAKAYIHLLQMSVEKTSKQDLMYAQKAGESIDRLNDLIGELLDVSKIQNGKLGLNITEFDFNEMISSAIEGIQYVSPTHTIHRSGKIKHLVKGDKERVQQVVINLLSNAVKYSPKANVVDINMVAKNGEVKVSVKDKGIGIRQENLLKIFQRYYRENERAAHFQGLGIGLYISHDIIQRLHGKLWAESKPGKGSTFYFTVPI